MWEDREAELRREYEEGVEVEEPGILPLFLPRLSSWHLKQEARRSREMKIYFCSVIRDFARAEAFIIVSIIVVEESG